MDISDFITTVLDGLQTAYASADQQGIISQHGPLFPLWIMGQPADLVGSDMFELLPELIGQEEVLAQVRRQEIPFLRLENINRTTMAGQIRYMNLLLLPALPQTEAALMILATDVTEQGQYLQQLMQNRNELHLAQQRLADLSYRLDYILRHYLAPEVTDALLQGDFKPELGGELHQVSTLFADIRDFTPLAEKLSPEHLVSLLNDYLDVVSRAIEQNNGSISQFQGDNVVAIFNMFGDQPDHAQQAVQAGIDLQQALRAYHHQRPISEPRLHFGVGINTGLALVGNVGAQRRYSYTAIGDAVNLAARITAATPPGAVWISLMTQRQLPAQIATNPLPPVTFKGKQTLTPLFQVLFELE